MAMIQSLSKIRAHTTGLVSVIVEKTQAADCIKMDGCISIRGSFITLGKRLPMERVSTEERND